MLRAVNHLSTVLLLMRWAEYFRRELPLDIPATVIRVAPLGGCNGQFNRGRNERGIPHEITIAEDGLNRPWRWVLSTLLHEQIHLLNMLRNGTGHDAAYRAAALAAGLVVTETGVTQSHVPDGPFLTLLKRGGIR